MRYIDAVAVHYYGTSATSMTNYIADFHNSFGKPIWVTEFAYEVRGFRVRAARSNRANAILVP
ncbi:hypothetical protein H0H87_010341 [Tephrocybe sp. NHM501043]|nr:hypothetical protein H0H87_010341 [Tephrocybe sp. NHM501043]